MKSPASPLWPAQTFISYSNVNSFSCTLLDIFYLHTCTTIFLDHTIHVFQQLMFFLKLRILRFSCLILFNCTYSKQFTIWKAISYISAIDQCKRLPFLKRGKKVIPCISAPNANQFQKRSRRILTLSSKPADLGHKMKTDYKIKTYRIVGKKTNKQKTKKQNKHRNHTRGSKSQGMAINR